MISVYIIEHPRLLHHGEKELLDCFDPKDIISVSALEDERL